jgi:flavodoxin
MITIYRAEIKLEEKLMEKILSLVAALAIGIVCFVGYAHTEEKAYVGRRALVAYFSATGNTAKVAKNLAKAVKADLFEIKPQQPYTEADLNWRDENSRSSVEMKDKSSRPAIKDKVEIMYKYDVVFVGFPIWWHREPAIIDTFIEEYDLSNKIIVPFATSGSEEIGDSGKNIQKIAPNAKVFAGKRFSPDVSVDELRKWAQDWL